MLLGPLGLKLVLILALLLGQLMMLRRLLLGLALVLLRLGLLVRLLLALSPELPLLGLLVLLLRNKDCVSCVPSVMLNRKMPHEAPH